MTHQLYQVSWVTTSWIGLYFLQKLLRVAALVLLGTGAAEDFPTKNVTHNKGLCLVDPERTQISHPVGKATDILYTHISDAHHYRLCNGWWAYVKISWENNQVLFCFTETLWSANQTMLKEYNCEGIACSVLFP